MDDYEWTRVVAERAGNTIDALSLHYYTLPNDDWHHKGAATGFPMAEYYAVLHKALRMEDLVEQHSHVLCRADPKGRLGLVVDEWGTWYDVEPGTNPGFLFQQNTMRDAIVAAVNLNIFNDHCDTVVMANIAQTVNVLQAMVLTEGAKMLRTPTYHVFAMYRGHQGARQLETYAETRLIGDEPMRSPNLHVSASQAPDGSILLTAANLDPEHPAPVECMMDSLKVGSVVTGELLSGLPGAHNTFDNPGAVVPRPMAEIRTDGGRFAAVLPPCSVAAFHIRP